ncbi:MAG: PEP-CTERM sorting domain-containing protein [Rubrivivax sp.]|nr:PEP-CTERM sorting domain-containing protein [Pseudomonadota bacterium]
MKPFRVAAAAAIAALVYSASPAWADKVTLDFDGPDGKGIPVATKEGKPVQTQVVDGRVVGSAVLGYYNGDPGFGRDGSQKLGVTFSDQAIAICSKESGQTGCYGNFGKPPSGIWAVGAVQDDAKSFDLWVDTGFAITELLFVYNDTGPSSAPGLQLFKDESLVQSTLLRPCATSFCGWREYASGDLTDLGITRIAFVGRPNQVVFDNITLNTTRQEPPPPLPEPSTAALLALGLASMGWAARRRKR